MRWGVVVMRNENGFDAGMNVGNVATFAALCIEAKVCGGEHFLEISNFGRHM